MFTQGCAALFPAVPTVASREGGGYKNVSPLGLHVSAVISFFKDVDLKSSIFQILMSNAPAYQNNWSPDKISVGIYFITLSSPCLDSYKGTLHVLD